MASMRRFFEEKDGPRIVGLTPINHPVSFPLITTASVEPAPPLKGNTSSSSSAASYTGSTSPSDPSSPTVFSAGPFSPSEGSSAPSVVDDPLNEQLATISISSEQSGRELRCILQGILDCNEVFPGSGFEDWYSHSLAHYGDKSLPSQAMCIFCNCRFKCWRSRMQHIAGHFEMGWTIEKRRPDFKVLKDMVDKGCLSQDIYDRCAVDSERPPVDGLRPSDWEPEEIVEKRRADERVENQIVVTESRRDLRNRKPRATRNDRTRKAEVKHLTDRSAV